MRSSPQTTLEDIVNDLGASDIVIDTKDIEKKSREGSYLLSYRISIPAKDLAKALNPEIWPIRVRVREFIHYRRNTQGRNSNGQQGGLSSQRQVAQQQHYGLVPQQLPDQQVGGQQAHAHFYQAVNNVGYQSQQQNQIYPNLTNMFSALSGPGAPNPNL